MKRLLLVFPLLFAVFTSRASADIVDDIIGMSEKFVNADVIIAFIEHHADELRGLEVADINRMMDAKVPDRVVEAVLRRHYGMPFEAAAKSAPPQQPAPQEPATRAPPASETEPPAEPPGSGDHVIYVIDTSYPVPIFGTVPWFNVGVDPFEFPHPQRHSSFFHHHGDKPRPEHSSLDGQPAAPPHQGWTSVMLPAAPATQPAHRPVNVAKALTVNSKPRSSAMPHTENRLMPASHLPPQVQVVHAPSTTAPVHIQPSVQHEMHSFGGAGSGGDSFKREGHP